MFFVGRPKVEKFTRLRVAANKLQGNLETYQLDIASNRQELFYIYVMAYRVLSKSTYHSICCASLPMAAPCALFSRWTSRTLEGQKWCLGRVEDLRGRRGKKASYYIIYHKFQHENTSKTAGTSHVPNRERPFYSRPSYLRMSTTQPFSNLYGSTLYQASN